MNNLSLSQFELPDLGQNAIIRQKTFTRTAVLYSTETKGKISTIIR